MSHSKMSKRGRSQYVEGWNPEAKRFIIRCSVCGCEGYDPAIDDDGFIHPSAELTDHVHNAIRSNLRKILKPLLLDELGRCEDCARVMDKV